MEGGGASLVPNANFEGTGNWSENRLSNFPGTSLWRGNWGTAAGRNGGYAYAISNQAYAWLESSAITAGPNTQYDAYAWVQGDIDTEDSWGQWILRVLQYDSAGSLPELGGRKLRRDASHCLGA